MRCLCDVLGGLLAIFAVKLRWLLRVSSVAPAPTTCHDPPGLTRAAAHDGPAITRIERESRPETLTPFTGEIIAFLTVLCWTVGSQFFEAAGKRVGSVTVNLVRLVLAAVFLCLTLLITKGQLIPMDFPLRNWGWLAVSGVIGFCPWRHVPLQGLCRDRTAHLHADHVPLRPGHRPDRLGVLGRDLPADAMAGNSGHSVRSGHGDSRTKRSRILRGRQPRGNESSRRSPRTGY